MISAAFPYQKKRQLIFGREMAYVEVGKGDKILTKLRRGERIGRYETTRIRKDRQKLEISLTISPVRDSTGRIVGAAKIAHGISARRRVERKLQERETQLSKLVAERELFLESERAARCEAERLSHLLQASLGCYISVTNFRPDIQ